MQNGGSAVLDSRSFEPSNATERSCKEMATKSNNLVNPSARDAMDRFKMEAASDLDVPAPS